MHHEDLPGHAAEAPLAQLERSLIDEYLRGRGYDHSTLGSLASAERNALLREASSFASGRLSEVETRWQFVHELHDGGDVPGTHRR